MCDTVMYCDVTTSQRVEGETAEEVFHEGCFLWERGAFDLFVFQDLLHAIKHTEGKDKQKKHNMSPLKLILCP